MKKTIFTTAFALAILFANAQLKVFTTGKVSVGSTTAPTYNLGVTGDIDAVASGNAYRIQGYKVLWYNSTATSNIFVGVNAGNSSMSGVNNTFMGYAAGNVNSSANDNTFVGLYSGYHTTTGGFNTFLGLQAGYVNVGGTDNSFVGVSAGQGNTSGYNNTFVGYNAGIGITTGNSNTCIGGGANVSGTGYATYANSTAIGNGALSDASGNIVIGNTTPSNIGGWLAWTNKSDGRFKFNVKEEVKGLEFIMKLRPVIYQLDTRKAEEFLTKNMPDSVKTLYMNGVDFAPSTQVIHSGFIAQEVEKAAKDCGFISSIVAAPSDTSNGSYGLSYAEVVVPLVKAVQELSHTVDSLLAVSKSQRTMQNPDGSQGNAGTIHDLELANSAVIFQNFPNPFGDGTTIKYFVPDNADAQIVFYDEFGAQLKNFKVQEKGLGQLNIASENLANGVYSYSLIVNGRAIDTKKMMRAK